MRASTDPFACASRDAHKIVEGVIESILEGIKAGEVTEDTLSDQIHEEVDNALIYTADQWVCAYGLHEHEDVIEEGLCQPSNVGEAIAAQAYSNLRAYIEEHDFAEAFAVAADAREENTPEEPRDEVTP